MAALQTYVVNRSTGVVIDDAGSTIFYPGGAVFQANPNNVSVERLFLARAIGTSIATPLPPPVTTSIGPGPAGPPGLPGGPAGSRYSVKIRMPLGGYLVSIPDNGALEAVTFPISTQKLYDVMGMFSQAQGDRIYVKSLAAGRYHVCANLLFAPSAVGYRHVELVHYDAPGGAKDQASSVIQAVSGGAISAVSVSHDFDGCDDDYFRIKVRQTSGGPINIWASFSAMLLGSGPQGSPGQTGPAWQPALSDRWALAAAKVAAVPSPPGSGPDPYASIRARLVAERDALKIEADGAGGLA